MNNQAFFPFRPDNLWYAKQWLIEPNPQARGRRWRAFAHPALIGFAVGLLSGGAAFKYFGFPF